MNKSRRNHLKHLINATVAAACAATLTLRSCTNDECGTGESIPRLSINGCTIKRYANCPNKDLRGVSLPFVDLYSGYFYGARLGNSDIHNADIRYANFRNAGLYNVRAEHVSGKGANFRFSQLRRARFYAGDLTGAKFERARLIDTDLEATTLTSANLVRADLTRSRMIWLVRPRCRSLMTPTSIAQRWGAGGSRVRRSGAPTCSMQASTTQSWSRRTSVRAPARRPVTAKLARISPTSTDRIFKRRISEAPTYEVRPSMVQRATGWISRARRWAVRGNAADIHLGNFRYTRMVCSHILNARFTSSDLRNSDLRFGDFRGTNFSGTTMRGADLRSVNFEGAILNSVDFRGTRTTGANFGSANLTGAVAQWPHLRRQFDWRAADRDCQTNDGARPMTTGHLRSTSLLCRRGSSCAVIPVDLGRACCLVPTPLSGSCRRFLRLCSSIHLPTWRSQPTNPPCRQIDRH